MQAVEFAEETESLFQMKDGSNNSTKYRKIVKEMTCGEIEDRVR